MTLSHLQCATIFFLTQVWTVAVDHFYTLFCLPWSNTSFVEWPLSLALLLNPTRIKYHFQKLDIKFRLPISWQQYDVVFSDDKRIVLSHLHLFFGILFLAACNVHFFRLEKPIAFTCMVEPVAESQLVLLHRSLANSFFYSWQSENIGLLLNLRFATAVCFYPH